MNSEEKSNKHYICLNRDCARYDPLCPLFNEPGCSCPIPFQQFEFTISDENIITGIKVKDPLKQSNKTIRIAKLNCLDEEDWLLKTYSEETPMCSDCNTPLIIDKEILEKSMPYGYIVECAKCGSSFLVKTQIVEHGQIDVRVFVENPTDFTEFYEKVNK